MDAVIIDATIEQTTGHRSNIARTELLPQFHRIELYDYCKRSLADWVHYIPNINYDIQFGNRLPQLSSVVY